MGWYVWLWPIVGMFLVVGTAHGWGDNERKEFFDLKPFRDLEPLKGFKRIFVITLSMSLLPAAAILLYTAVPELPGILQWDLITLPDGMRSTNFRVGQWLFIINFISNLWPVPVIGYGIWAASIGVWGLQAVNSGQRSFGYATPKGNLITQQLNRLWSSNRRKRDIPAAQQDIPAAQQTWSHHEDFQREMKRLNQLVGSASIDEQKQLKDLMREAERKDPQWTKNLKLLRSLVRDMEEILLEKD